MDNALEYIHVKSLEKFHPKYKDRTLQWAKIYFKMIQGDPDVEMLHEIDRGRLISFILLELAAKAPIPNNDEYFRRKGFAIEIRPMSMTLKMLHNFIVTTTDKSKYAYSEKDKYKEEKEKDKESAGHAVSNNTKALLEAVYKSGFNIYQLLGRMKKEYKINWVPDAVLDRVCGSYLKNKNSIKDRWPWFVKAVKTSWEDWNAKESMAQGAAYKAAPIPKALLDLVRSVGK